MKEIPVKSIEMREKVGQGSFTYQKRIRNCDRLQQIFQTSNYFKSLLRYKVDDLALIVLLLIILITGTYLNDLNTFNISGPMILFSLFSSHDHTLSIYQT
jgi:hypothetical protein